MADGKVGKLAVEVDASAERLGGNLQKAGQTIKQFSKQARKDLGDADDGFLDKLAHKAKSLKRERSQRGESALESMLSGGAGGVANFGMNALGMGLQGLVVEGIGKAFASGAENFSKLVTGEMDTGEAVNQWAKGIPILGEFVSGWKSILDLTTGEAQQAEHLNQLLKEQVTSTRAIGALQETLTDRKHMFGDEGSVEANRLAQLAKIAPDQAALRDPTDAEIKKEEGWLRRAAAAGNSSIGMQMLPGAEHRNQETSDFYNDAALRIIGRNKEVVKEYETKSTEINRLAEIQFQRVRQPIAVALIGDASKLLRGFQDMPGGNSAAAMRMQKLASVLTTGMAMQQGFKDIINNGDAGPAQKRAAWMGLADAKHWTDLATGSKNLNLEPYIPMRFASAELASGYYSGAAEYAKQKDEADYAGKADFGAQLAETNKYVAHMDAMMTAAMSKGSNVNLDVLFPDGGP